MRFFRRIAGILGLLKDEAHGVNDDEEDYTTDNQHHHHHHHHHHNHGGGGDEDDKDEQPRRPTKGFSVKVPVPVDRPYLGPVLTPSNPGEPAGVQGLRWYARRLRIDEDGDVAEEFLDEVLSTQVSCNAADNRRELPKFEVKYSTRPAKVRKQMISVDGKIHQSVEYQGKLLWT